MSLATSLGNERNLFDETPEHAHKLAARPADPAQPRARDAAPRRPRRLQRRARSTSPGRSPRGPPGWSARSTRICRPGARGDRRTASTSSSSPTACVGPRARRDPLAAGGRRRPPPPRARGHAPARRDHRRVRRAARGPPLRDADRLRRERRQPVPDARDARRAGRRGAHRARPADGDARVALDPEQAAQNVVKAIGKGLLKTISKMGISTIQSYRGAQIFEAVGLERELIDRHFTGTASRIGGVGLEVLAIGGAGAPRPRLSRAADPTELLPVGGVYAWRRDGEHHMWNPETIALVQHAVRSANGNVAAALEGDARCARGGARSPAFAKYREYARRSTRTRRARRRCAACCRSPRAATGRCDDAGDRARGGRAGERDRQALLHRGDEPRLDLARGARDARDRDEPPRRALEHGRGRGGPRALHARRQRRPPPLGDQAGRLRAASA